MSKRFSKMEKAQLRKAAADEIPSPQFVLSVDPGVKGALCLMETGTRKIQVFDTPVLDGQVDGAQLAAMVDQCRFQGTIAAVVEQVSSMPRQAGAFNFGRSAGVVHGVLDALGVPYELLHPNIWKGAMGLRRAVNETREQNKTRARELAVKLWPDRAADFKRVKDDGRAEAALLARHYCTKMGW